MLCDLPEMPHIVVAELRSLPNHQKAQLIYSQSHRRDGRAESSLRTPVVLISICALTVAGTGGGHYPAAVDRIPTQWRLYTAHASTVGVMNTRTANCNDTPC